MLPQQNQEIYDVTGIEHKIDEHYPNRSVVIDLGNSDPAFVFSNLSDEKQVTAKFKCHFWLNNLIKP